MGTETAKSIKARKEGEVNAVIKKIAELYALCGLGELQAEYTVTPSGTELIKVHGEYLNISINSMSSNAKTLFNYLFNDCRDYVGRIRES